MEYELTPYPLFGGGFATRSTINGHWGAGKYVDERGYTVTILPPIYKNIKGASIGRGTTGKNRGSKARRPMTRAHFQYGLIGKV